MSFKILPKENADKFKNGFGRSNPNFYPTLPDPVGRFSFDLFSPCSTIKAIIGPKVCYMIVFSICAVLLVVVGVMFGYFIFTTWIGVKLAT